MKMNYTALRELIFVVIIITFMGFAWGWWPLQGFVVGCIFLAWLIVRLLEEVVGNG